MNRLLPPYQTIKKCRYNYLLVPDSAISATHFTDNTSESCTTPQPMDKIEPGYVVLLSPDGEKFNQKMAMEMSKKDHLIFICGHYEGFDERIKTLSDKIVSIGDYVLTGGEIPCMVMVDSITRLIPGVINSESLDSESFNDNYLDYTAYTKPYEYRGMKVPDVLVSGDHKKIDEWRRIEREKKTKEKRPDLLGDD